MPLFFALTIYTISAFYFGETLQANTTLAESQGLKILLKLLGSSIFLKSESPATITAFSLTNSVSF